MQTMTLYVFRLVDQLNVLQGIVVIFATPLPQVWQRLTAAEHPEEVPDTISDKVAVQLIEELDACSVGDDPTSHGGSVLQQVFHDGKVTQNHRAAYAGLSEFPAVRVTPPPRSLRGWVEHAYHHELLSSQG